MARFIYKPLVTYFPGNTPEETEENKLNFIQAYKDSLTSGELLVDLYNYEIYVANNGLEYPIPSTPELKEEIIKWIESDEGPLGSLSKNDLLNIKSDDSSEANIARKKEKVQSMIKEVELYHKACQEKIDEDLNTLRRTNREVEVFYDNLSSFTRKMAYTSNADNSEVAKVVYEVIAKYIELYKRLLNILKFTDYLNQTDILTNLEKEQNEKLKDIFAEIVNNEVAINTKLDRSKIKDNDTYKKPNMSFELNLNNIDAGNQFFARMNSIPKIDTDYYERIIDGNKIKIVKKGGNS